MPILGGSGDYLDWLKTKWEDMYLHEPVPKDMQAQADNILGGENSPAMIWDGDGLILSIV